MNDSKLFFDCLHEWRIDVRQDGFFVNNGVFGWHPIAQFMDALNLWAWLMRKYPKGYKENPDNA